MMQAVIMAAGNSTRTHPLTITRPKPLLKVLNRTVIEHNLEQLDGLVSEVIIITGYKEKLIRQYLGDKFKKISLAYVEQKERLGTAHAVSSAERLIKDRFIVLNGDDLYSKKDLKNLVKHKYAVLAQKVNDPSRFGVFVLDGLYVKSLIEKPAKFVSDLANTGCYLFDREIFSVIKSLKKSPRGEYEITGAVTALAKKEKVACLTVEDYWFPISYPWSLLEANEFFVKRLKKFSVKGTIEKGCTIKGTVMVGKGSVLKSGTYIEGPVVIGENCEIGPNCYLRSGATIGNNCKVGQAVEIKNSIIGDNSKVPHLSYVGDSVIGEHCNLGAGTITANLRHDNASIKSMVKDALVDSGRRKLGAIIGDYVHTGINTSIYPGRKIWPNLGTGPGQIVDRDIME